jgi:hypothetical protein
MSVSKIFEMSGGNNCKLKSHSEWMAAANNILRIESARNISHCLQSGWKELSARWSNMFLNAAAPSASYTHHVMQRRIHHVAPKWLVCVGCDVVIFFVALVVQLSQPAAMQFKCEIGITWADSPQMYAASVHICVCIFSNAITGAGRVSAARDASISTQEKCTSRYIQTECNTLRYILLFLLRHSGRCWCRQ